MTDRSGPGWTSGSAERFRALKGLRVGAIANPTSVDLGMVHIADHLRAAEGVTLWRRSSAPSMGSGPTPRT